MDSDSDPEPIASVSGLVQHHLTYVYSQIKHYLLSHFFYFLLPDAYLETAGECPLPKNEIEDI